MSKIKSATLITLRMGHHANASGYGRLAQELQDYADIIELRQPETLLQKSLTRMLRPLVKQADATWYNRASLLVELRAAKRWLTSTNRIFHFLYGENTYCHMGSVKQRMRKNNALLATYHTPLWRMHELVRNTKPLADLDGVIAMSTTQLEYFDKVLGHGRTFFIPHGVDTNYFKPAEQAQPEAPPQFITVGHHLRDFEVLAEVATKVGREFPQVKFLVLAWPDRVGPVKGLANVECKTGVTDAELLEYYQNATALLLPLRDATANNSLLEGMACGLPVLSTDLQGVRDYTSADNRVLHASGDAGPLVEAVMEMCSGTLDTTAMRKASRAKALELDWSVIADNTRHVYQQFA
ncbi:MAG: glycosyltransferase [Pseudomonadota bacterium]